MRKAAIVIVLAAGLTAGIGAQQSASDVTQWRGANRDGVVTGFKAPSAWPEQLTQIWKIEVGLGYATPIVVGNRVYMFSRQNDDEVMSAIDAASGKVLWRTAYSAPFEMNSAAAPHNKGPKSTPVFSNGKLFAIGMTGVITAYDANTGKQLWQKPGSEPLPLYTTHSFSPIIEGGLVIFHVGGHGGGALTAFDINTGAAKWSWSGDGPGYGSPIVITLDGTRQVITKTQQKLVGVDVSNGTLLWEVPYVTQSTTNSLTPLVYGQTVILGGNGRPVEAYAPRRRNNQWVAEKVWENGDVTMRMTNGVIVGDMLVSLSTRNSGQYFTLDAKTGKLLWTSEGRQAVNASVLKVGDTLLSLENDGELVVLRPAGPAMEPLRRYRVADSETFSTWTQPTLSGNRIFIKDLTSLAVWVAD